MEKREGWMQTFRHDVDLGNANFICHSDGGTRQGNCSASGWFIEAVIEAGGQSQRVPSAMSGTFLSQPISSFTAELIALDEAILYMYQLVLKCTGFSRKRARTRAEPSA